MARRWFLQNCRRFNLKNEDKTMKIENNILKKLFQNVYFINGTAYAGKSTMVKLLAEKHDGIACGENYHEELMHTIDELHQPNLSYFKTMRDWQEFISRTPEEYEAWIVGCGREATDLEIIKLIQLVEKGKKIFVDTNISIEILKGISDYRHVVIMLSSQSMSVNRFFEREDAEKQFILKQIHKASDPETALENYKKCLEKVNSNERYDAFANSGFFTMVRDEDRTIEERLAVLEQHFGF